MRIFSVLLGMLFIGVACGGSETPPAPPPAATTTAPPPQPPAPVASYATKAFPCCGDKRTNQIVEEYLDIAEGLAGLNNKIDGNITAIDGVSQAARKELGPAQVTQLLAIEQIGRTMHANKDLTARRAEFKKLTAAVLALVRLSPGGTEYRIAEVYCAGLDGAWLTTKAELINPYGAPDTSCAVYR